MAGFAPNQSEEVWLPLAHPKVLQSSMINITIL
jgi:hypothetical protein